MSAFSGSERGNEIEKCFFFSFFFCKTELGACGHGTAQCLHDPIRVSATAAYCGMKTLHSGPRVSLCYPWSIAWGDWMGLCTLRLGSNFHPLTSWPLQPPPTASPIKTLRCVLTCTLSPLQQADGEEGAEPPRNNSFASRLDKKSEDLWPTASLQFLCIIFLLLRSVRQIFCWSCWPKLKTEKVNKKHCDAQVFLRVNAGVQITLLSWKSKPPTTETNAQRVELRLGNVLIMNFVCVCNLRKYKQWLHT